MAWLKLAAGAALLLGALALQQQQQQQRQLPFCDPNSAMHKDLIIVSTLDGKLTAFVADTGQKAWDLQTESLLSSNLHHVELTSNGKWVRLVPSLSGSLYRLSAEELEPLPVTAEQLLSSSFKYSDELVVAGSRRTAYAGVEAGSGRVLYRCGAGDCHATETTSPDMIIVKHTAHTVRALDPRSGHEKWNFSVAEHELSVSDASACASSGQRQVVDFDVTLVLPDGVVAARRENSLLWRQQLDVPVADAWTLKSGKLERVDVLTAAASEQAALYIGVHNQQIYVQEGISFNARGSSMLAPLPWRPRPARPLLSGPTHTDTELQQLEPESGALALRTLYGNTAMSIGNHGYFLRAAESKTCDQGTSVSEDQLLESMSASDSHEDLHHVHVHVSSLWMWWKEVLLIAISSALVMNLMIWPRFFAPKFLPPPPLPVNSPQEYIIVQRPYELPAPPPSPPEYVSRYATDFTPLRCLGRGGFGVVFECRNNIDHCSYAVKRITLPRRESKRARVLREVRALATLEHENIVRYFNAWLEEPPPAWQRERDAQWLRELEGVSVSLTEDPLSESHKATDTTPANNSIHTQDKDTVMLNLQKPQWEQGLDAQFENSGLTAKRNRSLSCNDSFRIVFSENTKEKDKTKENSLNNKITEDDSFIVFAESGDVNHNSEGAGDAPTNKHLEKVKNSECSSQSPNPKKKKGHRRHWSLDLCVRSEDEGGSNRTEVYLYIQMQLCRRDSLHTWLRHHRTSVHTDQVINIFSQIVSAVEYVHLAGLIHRDLKPSNIFFAPDGKVKVGDFGLVTTISDNSSDGAADSFEPQTRHTHRVGTHLYMSPEQLRGDPYDFKVDIYSLGLILFELLHPFSTESERVATLLRLRDGHLPAAFRQRLPQETNLLESMLSASPSERPTANGVRCRAPLCHLTQPSVQVSVSA